MSSTTGAMDALRRVTRHLLGTEDAHVKLRIQSADPVMVELVGYPDSDWAGDPSSRKSQSSGHGMSTHIIFSKTKLCGDEQWNGGVPRDVLDC